MISEVVFFFRSAIAPAYGKGWYLRSQPFEPQSEDSKLAVVRALYM